MKNSILLILMILASFLGFAQVESPPIQKENSLEEYFIDTTAANKMQKAELKEIKNSKISLLIDMYNDQCKSEGYKVQLYSGKSKVEATKVRSEFINKYEDELNSTIIYRQPNFKLRVGNFKDRLTAIKYLELIKKEFPSAFIVQDEIQVQF